MEKQDRVKRLKALGKYVQDVRARKSLRQADIPERGGPSQSWVGMLEAGSLTTYPKEGTQKSLAAALGVDLADIKAVLGEETSLMIEARPRPSFSVIEGASQARFAPTDWELSIIRAAEAEDVWYGPLYQPGLWNKRPEDRKSHFRYLDGLVDEARSLRENDEAESKAN